MRTLKQIDRDIEKATTQEEFWALGKEKAERLVQLDRDYHPKQRAAWGEEILSMLSENFLGEVWGQEIRGCINNAITQYLFQQMSLGRIFNHNDAEDLSVIFCEKLNINYGEPV